MPEYEKQTWVNNPAGNTPVSAERLNHMEDGIDAALPRDEAETLYVTKTQGDTFLTRNTAEPFFVSHEEADSLFLTPEDAGAKSTFGTILPTVVGRLAGDLHRVGGDSFILAGAPVATVRDSFSVEDGTQLGPVGHQPDTYPLNSIGYDSYGGGYPFVREGKVLLFETTRTGIAVSPGAGAQALAVDIVTGSTTRTRPTFEVNRGNDGVYRFSLTATQIVLERDDTELVSVGYTGLETLGATRHVEVEWDGTDTLRFLVDGEVEVEFTDPTPLPATGDQVVVTAVGGTVNAGRNFLDNFTAVASGTLHWEPVFGNVTAPPADFYQVRAAGPVTVAADVAPPGILIQRDTTATRLRVVTGTGPTTGPLTVVATRWEEGGAAVTPDTITVTVADGDIMASSTATFATVAGDLWKIDVTAANGTPADLLVALDCVPTV